MAKRNRNIDKNMNNMQTKNSNSGNSSSNMNEQPPRKRRKHKHETEGIAMSKQLQMKLKAQSDSCTKKKKQKSNRVCTNGKPLPSLKDLELLFQDSDGDDGDKHLETNTAERKDTPEIVIISDPDSLFSPTTRARITQQAKQILANNSKQNGNRTNIPVKRKSPIFNGSTYELCDLTLSSDEDQDDNEKQNNNQATSQIKPDIMFDCKPYNNSQNLPVEQTSGRRISSGSENILECAIKVPNLPLPSTSNTKSASEAFEPLPSTSRDNVTFVKNVELFNMSLKKIAKAEDVSTDIEDKDLQVMEIPEDTVTTGDKPEMDPENSKRIFNTPDIAVNSKFSDNVMNLDSGNTNLPVLYNSKNKLDTDPKMGNMSTVNMKVDTIEIESEIPHESTLNNSNSVILINLNDGNDTDSDMQNSPTLNNSNNAVPNSIYVDDDEVFLFPEPESSEHHSPIDNHKSVMNNNTNNSDGTPIETTDVDAVIAQNEKLLNILKQKISSSLNAVVDVSATPERSHGTKTYAEKPPCCTIGGVLYDSNKQICKRCGLPDNMLCRCRYTWQYDQHDKYSGNNLDSSRRKHQAKLNYTQNVYNVPNYSSRLSPTSSTLSVLDGAEQQPQFDSTQISHGLTNCVKPFDSETKTDPITPQKQIKTSDLYTELMTLEQQALFPNTENFECEICTEEYLPGCGVVLRECVHIFCKECLADVVRHCEEPEIACPALGCQGKLQQREIRALITPQDYEKWLARGLAAAESGTHDAFHCRTRDCNGWALCEPGVRIFPCPVCKQLNCVTCQAIHDDETCEQYQYRLQNGANNRSNAETDEKTRKLLNSWIAKGTAMECPECSVVLTKTFGCDWIKCSACKTEICWATRGRRWGPRGRGDTSGGCRCRIKRKRCHPSCHDCH